MISSVDRYGVFGNPISHSKSPILHMEFAQQSQEAIEYSAQCVDIDGFKTAADNFFKEGGKGLNVTVPFKLEAYHYAQALTSRAQRAGAVNTLSIDHSGSIVGDNTDGVGMINDIKNNLSWPLRKKSILILGAGGAVRGVLEPLINEAPMSITVANRTLKKAESLAADFSDLFTIKVSGFTDLRGPFDLIINGTSASLSGKLPPITATTIHDNSCCYDMMYAKQQTSFLEWANKHGVTQLSDGLGMLVCQGAESFFIWRHYRPNTKSVINQLRESL